MKTFGPLYAHTLKYYHRNLLPVVEKGTTQETTRPYRKGVCLVFRLPKTYLGLAVGIWVYQPENIDDDDAVDALMADALKLSQTFSAEEVGEW